MADSAHFSPYRPDGKLVSSCSRSPTEDYSSLADEVNKEFPNTKVIGYPLNIANEEDTLALIDEILNATGRLDVWVCSSGLLGPSSIEATTPADLQKCFEANSMAPFFALKYGPPAMAKLAIKKGNYPNAAPKDQKYGSIIVVSSVASTYGGKCTCAGSCRAHIWSNTRLGHRLK
ncbi:MAG: hypothetical protein LQ347_002005 [Umbilicaria vellea]|nr:MAG: hypothetical protein LQ347_002005 [Umbilicaria vellea]